MARALIVDEFLGAHDDWRHLALEDIQEVEQGDDSEDEDIFDFQKSFMTMVACECAKEAREEGHNIIITCPESEMIEGVYSEIEEPADFDHVIDSTSKSMVEVCGHLDEIIQAMPA